MYCAHGHRTHVAGEDVRLRLAVIGCSELAYRPIHMPLDLSACKAGGCLSAGLPAI
jgi:hypothetical protein